MPVVVFDPSIEIVNAVLKESVLFLTISGKFISSNFSFKAGIHINPLPYLVIKFIASGVTISAAISKSPSFSLSSSSTTIIIFPCFKSSTASKIVLNPVIKSPLYY